MTLVYLYENDYGIGHVINLISYNQTITCFQSAKQFEAMYDIMKFEVKNKV